SKRDWSSDVCSSDLAFCQAGVIGKEVDAPPTICPVDVAELQRFGIGYPNDRCRVESGADFKTGSQILVGVRAGQRGEVWGIACCKSCGELTDAIEMLYELMGGVRRI